MLIYRNAKPTDARLYFDWANDPETRRQSFNTASISLETHTSWFTRKLANPDALLLVFENDASQAVGQARFERTPIADMPDEIIIGVSVDARFRGQGLASQVISQGCQACKKQWGAVTIHAYIRPENQGSIRSFTKAGFNFSHESGKFGAPSFVYTKTV